MKTYKRIEKRRTCYNKSSLLRSHMLTPKHDGAQLSPCHMTFLGFFLLGKVFVCQLDWATGCPGSW